MFHGKLCIKCTKNGSAKIRISAVTGGPQIGGGAVLGGAVITKEVSILSRDVAASNGGWL